MTVTSSTLSSLLVFFVGFGLVTFALRLWKRRIPGVRGRTAVTAATYFLRYAAALEYYGLRAAEIEAHVDALRANLASLADDELRHAISGLGAPRTWPPPSPGTCAVRPRCVASCGSGWRRCS